MMFDEHSHVSGGRSSTMVEDYEEDEARPWTKHVIDSLTSSSLVLSHGEERAMKISVWCCISCIFPCGAFDVIRIVHTNGHVEEFSRVVRVEDVLKANPKHVLRKSSISSSTDGKIVCKSVTLDPDTELQRGKVYFLQPVICPTEKRRKSSSAERRKKRELEKKKNHESEKESLISDRYLSDILSEKFSFKKDNQRGRVALWRPHLETIPEIASDLHQITVP